MRILLSGVIALVASVRRRGRHFPNAARRLSFLAVVVATVIALHRMALGVETAPAGVPVQLSWETLLTIYGPMAGMLIWFMKRDAEREAELRMLIRENTGALTRIDSTMEEIRNDLEKLRLAIYQLRDEARETRRIPTNIE